MQIPNLPYLRNVPIIGARLYEALNAIQNQATAVETQTNANPFGQPPAPPNIQGVSVTGQNGVLHVSIQDQSAELRRGVSYFVEHADNPSFTDPQIRHLGDSRSFTEFIGNTSRFVRAYSSYAASPASDHAYHGSASAPVAVNGGGSIGGPRFLPSQGSGTGAAGQGGVGPGPVPVRRDSAGFDWTLQRAQGSRGGFAGSGTPAGSGAASGSGGGGGTPVATQGTIVDTHAHRLANYPSVRYPVNTLFYETDRTVSYSVQSASGTVTVTTGTTVTWVSGNKFINTGTGFTAAQWPAGTPIVINGVTCRVSVVNSATSITLQAATTNAAGVSYLVASGRWVYLSGEYAAALASLPADLGENDTTILSTKVALGFPFFENAVYFHQLQWNLAAWQRGPHDLEHSDTFHEFGAAPADGGWHSCDGSAVVYLKYDGTTASRTVPNLAATAAYALGGAAYSATLVAPVLPTVTTTVPAAAAAGAASAGTGVADNTGASSTAVLTPPFSGGGGGGGGGGTDIAGTVTLPGDPIENFAVIKYYRR